MIKILFFGDVIGRPGRTALAKSLPEFKKEFDPDFIIANGENLSHGFGVSRESLEEILRAGVDIVTSGNHIFDKREAAELLQDKNIPLLRPLNYPPSLPGEGVRVFEKNGKKILVVNALGRVYMKGEYDDPFRALDKVLESYAIKENLDKAGKKELVDAIIVDWHAEASSEKMVMGYYLDGKVSAVLGTHYHITTADERVLEKGTAHISDVGMVGPRDSVIGSTVESVLQRFLMQLPLRLEIAEDGPVEINAMFIEIDEKSGLAKSIKRVRKVIQL